MRITVQHKTEYHGGKPVELTITRQVGVQEIEVGGERITVGELVITDSKYGQTRTYTRDPRGVWIGPEATRQVKEIAAKAMYDQGIW